LWELACQRKGRQAAPRSHRYHQPIRQPGAAAQPFRRQAGSHSCRAWCSLWRCWVCP